MNVDLIEVPRREALVKIDAYRDHLQRRSDERAAKVLAAYEAMAEGTPVIELSKSIGNAGWTDEGMPTLAVARADREWVRVDLHPERTTTVVFNATAEAHATVGQWAQGTSNPGPTLYRRVPVAAFPKHPRSLAPLEGPEYRHWIRKRAAVPLIPPEAREASNHAALHKLFILWEAVWEEAPPVDPMLLRHLGEDLYAVLAHWDLTEVERAVMAEYMN